MYVHSDIKPSNMVIGLGRDEKRVYLIDYDISDSFRDKDFSVYEVEPAQAHYGTLPFTSIDAHNGARESRFVWDKGGWEGGREGERGRGPTTEINKVSKTSTVHA